MANHPIRKAVGVLRAWLAMVAIVMVWNAFVAETYVIGGPARPLPFLFIAVLACVWSYRSWHMNTVILCASIMSVACFLRGVEVVVYADKFPLRNRLTGLSIWITLAGTFLAFGILNLIASSRREAERVWSDQSSEG